VGIRALCSGGEGQHLATSLVPIVKDCSGLRSFGVAGDFTDFAGRNLCRGFADPFWARSAFGTSAFSIPVVEPRDFTDIARTVAVGLSRSGKRWRRSDDGWRALSWHIEPA
jgi:hypothetical protein